MVKCKIGKLEERLDAEYPHNIAVGYIREGILGSRPTVGECFFLDSFRTSLVQEVIGYSIIKTINSVYKIEYLDVEGLFIDAKNKEDIKNFYKAEGLYTIEGTQYIVGRIQPANEIFPATKEAWDQREKFVVNISQFIFNWFDAYLHLSYDEYDDVLNHWINWGDQKICIQGVKEGYSK